MNMNENYLFNVIAVVLVTASVTLSTPIPAENPQQSHTNKPDSLFNIPFLEFSNGGVRVNFGGYHAEAGLGGLLGDSRTNGGLFASAGIPSGPHASAGLGGDVHGENDSHTRGGLYARAGLGNGRSETAAGLGGNIDGKNPSGNEGQIYAAKSNNGRTRIVFKNYDSDKKKFIQQIPQSKINERYSLTDDEISKNLPTDIIKADNDNINRRDISSVPDEKLNAIEPIVVPVTDASSHVYPTRRCRRKRLCNNARKTITHQQLPLSQNPVDIGVEKYLPAFSQLSVDDESSDGQLADNTGYKTIAVAPGPAPSPPQSHQKPRSTTLFDDIFNIPISVLSAVNQLLNNKSG